MDSFIEPPSHAAILRRGRRPALIPPTADLDSFFNFSPQGSNSGRPAMFVLPSASTGSNGSSPTSLNFDEGFWGNEIGKSELRWGDERLDVDEVDRGLVMKDVSSWVNSEDFDSTDLDANSPPLFAPVALRSVTFNNESNDGSSNESEDYTRANQHRGGLQTRPTSPLSCTRTEEVEIQRRRLVQAGMWADRDEMEGIETIR